MRSSHVFEARADAIFAPEQGENKWHHAVFAQFGSEKAFIFKLFRKTQTRGVSKITGTRTGR